MSTVLSPHDTSFAKQLVQRFAWKESRMLRGFWIAVALLAIVEQFVSAQFMFDARAVPDWMFASAWGAAALYAVGAAITLFSAEREELTRDYLIQLPSRWLPMFVGKLLVAVLSTLALALILSLTGFLIAGAWPSGVAASQVLGVAGVAAVEALVWGLFFSLIMKQSLLAAVLAMAAASFSAQFGVISTVPSTQAFSAAGYAKAAPLRLLLSGFVLLLDLRLATRWLNPLPPPIFTPSNSPWRKPGGPQTNPQRANKKHNATKIDARPLALADLARIVEDPLLGYTDIAAAHTRH